MSRINISTVNPDPTLKRTLDKIETKRLVGGGHAPADGVLEIVRSTASPKEPGQLDLIAHARGGELQLSSWLISSQERESAALRRQLADGMISEVRLLGCLTGATAAGGAAMRHLKEVLGVPVYGTTSLIGAIDFAGPGFIGDDFLIECADLEGPAFLVERPLDWFAMPDRPLETVALDLQVSDLEPEMAEDMASNIRPADDLTTLLAQRNGDLWVAPGLLLMPDAELRYAAAATGRPGQCFRVTSLLGGKLLRVYPKGYPDGVLFRPAQPLAL